MHSRWVSYLLGPQLAAADWTTRHQALGVVMVLGPGVPTLLGYAVWYALAGDAVRMWLPLMYSAAALALLLALRWTGQVKVVQLLVMMGLLPYFLVQMVQGGVMGDSGFWAGMYPVMAYFFMGVRGGTQWVVTLLLGLLGLILLDVWGDLGGYYTPPTLLVIAGVVVAVSLLMVMYERWRMVSERYLSKQATRLHLANQALQRAEEHMRQMALMDGLTGLPNRELFFDRLKVSLAHAHRHGGHVAVLFADLDGFKLINDTWGHHVGDDVLVEAARRLLSRVRGEDMVARLGGDEFVVLLTDIQNREAAERVAAELRQVVAQPLRVDGHDCSVGVSVGVCLYPDDARSQDELMALADHAMYRDKARRRGAPYPPAPD